MKAVCILLCLALPAAIVGRIVDQSPQPQYPQIGRLVVNPLDYIDQYQYKAAQDGAAASNENSRETNADVASYIEKYIEVLNYDEAKNKKDKKKNKGKTPKIDQQWINQLAAQARLDKLRESEQLYRQQYAPQYVYAEPQREIYYEKPSRAFNMMYRQGDSQENVNEIKYIGDNSQKYVKEGRFSSDNSQKYVKESKYFKNQKPVFRQPQLPQQTRFAEQPTQESRQAQLAQQTRFVDQPSQESRQAQFAQQTRFADQPSQESRQAQFAQQTRFVDQQESREIPTYGDAITWQGLSMAAGPNFPVTTKEDIEKIYADAYKTMNHYTEETKAQFHKDYEIAASLENEEVHLNATEMMRKHQFNVEEHTVRTDDGFILTLFRIAPTAATTERAPVVLFVHGLLGSADDWLLMGPNKSLPYLLAEAGYDVWLGNTRGSKYSRHHVSKHPAQPDFWQYSNDEIALHDLPAMIDYTLQTAQQEKLVYVGHSQGTTAFFALAASRPAYNDKITMMYALSPMVYMTHARSPLIKMIAPNSAFFERLRQQIGSGEFRPSKALLSTIGGDLCEKEIDCKFVCSNLNFVMSGVNMAQLNASLVPVIVAHMGAGASTRQMKQYGQAVASNEFRMYDYGAEMNAKVYGAAQPPKYQLSAVSSPVSLYYSEEDWLAAPVDVERLRRELPNVAEYYKVPEKDFSSMDFQVGKSAPATVNKRILESIQKNTATY